MTRRHNNQHKISERGSWRDNPRRIITPCAIIALLSFMLAWYWRGTVTSQQEENIASLREPAKKERIYTHPLLLCDTSGSMRSSTYQPLQEQFNTFVHRNTHDGETVSVYFREMTTGRWVSINEDERYSPASLLKVPVMIAYFKYAEAHPEVLKELILYDGSFDKNQQEDFKSDQYIRPGHTYSVDELLHAMIAYSDNNALELLNSRLDPQFVLEVYSDLGITFQQSDLADFMTVKSYASIFRVLYNSTYLNREYSEKAMRLFIEPDFPQGIAAGIPKEASSTVVAQKFGERSILGYSYVSHNNALLEREIHDCGIVYYPKNPYLLCIMTKSKDTDFSNAISLIQGISRIAYGWEKER